MTSSTTTSDFVMWEAMHWECPPEATCCATHTVTIPAEALELLRVAAAISGVPMQTFLGRAVSERMSAIFS